MTRRATFDDLRAGPLCFLGLGFGSGLAPLAPGTFGTLAAIPLYLIAISFSFIGFLVATLVICVAGIWICESTAKQLDAHDHGAIVWDEIGGYFVTMALVAPSFINIVCGFLLFRLLDIAKPWPIRLIDQRVEGGIGIMLDDILAGTFAAVLLLVFNQLNPGGIFS